MSFFINKNNLCFLILLCLFTSKIFAEYKVEKANFTIKFKDEINSFKVMAIYLLPDEELNIEIIDQNKKSQFKINNHNRYLTQINKNKWSWRAPNEKGLYKIKIKNITVADSMVLNVFVMVPFSELKTENLNGYNIGKYPNIPLKQLPIYKPPRGFVEVTKENEITHISPHFQLKQFLSKQTSDYPKYVVIRERLILKLELILEKVNEKGYAANTFHIMSGYRTPYYNKAIGNVKYSRHLWGGAADIFIDENPKDNMMDDLNKDRINNWKDAKILYDIIDQMYGRTFYEAFTGGLGRYKKTTNHGPFVHVDVRGFRARWGE